MKWNKNYIKLVMRKLFKFNYENQYENNILSKNKKSKETGNYWTRLKWNNICCVLDLIFVDMSTLLLCLIDVCWTNISEYQIPIEIKILG